MLLERQFFVILREKILKVWNKKININIDFNYLFFCNNIGVFFLLFTVEINAPKQAEEFPGLKNQLKDFDEDEDEKLNKVVNSSGLPEPDKIGNSQLENPIQVDVSVSVDESKNIEKVNEVINVKKSVKVEEPVKAEESSKVDASKVVDKLNEINEPIKVEKPREVEKPNVTASPKSSLWNWWSSWLI